MTAALIMSCLLPYFIVKYIAHQKKSPYTKQSIALPNLNESDLDEDNDAEDNVAETNDSEWQFVNPHSGDSMALIFNRLGLSAKNLLLVMENNPHAKMLTNIKPNQQLQFLIKDNRLEKLIIPMNAVEDLTIYREEGAYKTQIDTKNTTTDNLYVTGSIKGSLFNTATQLNIPNKIVMQMTEILNKQIDFSRAIRSGDQFSIVYEAYYVKDKMIGTGNIQAVRYTSHDKTLEAVRYTNSNGEYDYYSPTGNSFQKAFNRYPIKFSHISSTFSAARMHPALHYKRAHRGIDLAAPIGTPIYATADGVIETIGRNSGYGNMIKIKHDRPYSSLYAHMLRFQKGLSRGSRVKRGQVIGYVGQTGLATGPHCHYELRVNNIPRNPTSINLPTANPISAHEIAAFKNRATTLLAHLKLYEDANLAAKSEKNVDVG